MSRNDDAIEIFEELGLTFLQAKTYVALVTLGEAAIKEISKVSNVARQDIYRIMPTLEKLGLAECEISKPTLYRAIPLKEGSSMMLHKMIEEDRTLREKIKLLSNSVKE